MKTHEYSLTIRIPCTGDAEQQSEIFNAIRSAYSEMKAVAGELGGTSAASIVRKVTRRPAQVAAPVMAVEVAQVAQVVEYAVPLACCDELAPDTYPPAPYPPAPSNDPMQGVTKGRSRSPLAAAPAA